MPELSVLWTDCRHSQASTLTVVAVSDSGRAVIRARGSVLPSVYAVLVPDALRVRREPQNGASCRIISRTMSNPQDNFTNSGEIFHDPWRRPTDLALLSTPEFSRTLSTYTPAAQPPYPPSRRCYGHSMGSRKLKGAARLPAAATSPQCSCVHSGKTLNTVLPLYPNSCTRPICEV